MPIALCGSLNRLVMIRRASSSFLALLSPPPPLSTQVEGALVGPEESIHATPTPLKDAEQSVEYPEAMAQPSMTTPATGEDTCPKVIICGECHKVPDADPKDASGQLECDQQLINELAK